MTKKQRRRRPKMPDFNLDNFNKMFGSPRKFTGTLKDMVPKPKKRSKK